MDSSVSPWTPVKLICGIFIILGIISGVIVISLLVLYLDPKSDDLTVNYNTNGDFNTVFATNLIVGKETSVVDLESLTQQVNQHLSLPAYQLGIRSATLVPGTSVIKATSTSRKKKRQTQTRGVISCDAHINQENEDIQQGDKFVVAFYPRNWPPLVCGNNRCNRDQMEKVKSKLVARFGMTPFSPAVKLNDGSVLSIETRFCVFGSVDSVTTTNTTATSSIKPGLQTANPGATVTTTVPQTSSACTDGIKNQDETAVDCGGAICAAKCALEQTCSKNADCANGNCHSTLKTCQIPSCSDGNKNQDETAVDCGGAICAAKCALEQTCSKNADCANGNCHSTLKTCQTPSCSDGNKNQNEVDVDCSGICAAKCLATQSCLTNADCASTFCSTTSKKCDANQTKVECTPSNPTKSDIFAGRIRRDPNAGLLDLSNYNSVDMQSHTATVLIDGQVLLAGGVDSYFGFLQITELYDPAIQTWMATTGKMNFARMFHTATRLNDGTVLVAGGDSGSGAVNTAELYNPNTQTWTTTTGNMALARMFHTASLLNDGKVLVAGGHSSSGAVNTAELYNPSTQTWSTTTGNMAVPRRYHTASLLNDGKVLVAGGDSGSGAVNTAELYNPSTQTWSTTTGNMAVVRKYHTASLLNNGKVLIAGGSASGGL
ncbi:unnamed protein product, partial [Adineta ricciae]